MSLWKEDPWTGMFTVKLMDVLGKYVGSLDGIECILTIGGGNCRDALGIAIKYIPEALVVACDPMTKPAFSLFEKAGINIVYARQRFQQFSFKGRFAGKTLVEMSHVLQLFSTSQQLQILKKIKEDIGPDGVLILVDEIKRPGLSGLYDYILNRLFNRLKGMYNRQVSISDFEALARSAGFYVLFKEQYYRGSVVLFLKVQN